MKRVLGVSQHTGPRARTAFPETPELSILRMAIRCFGSGVVDRWCSTIALDRTKFFHSLRLANREVVVNVDPNHGKNFCGSTRFCDGKLGNVGILNQVALLHDHAQ